MAVNQTRTRHKQAKRRALSKVRKMFGGPPPQTRVYHRELGWVRITGWSGDDEVR